MDPSLRDPSRDEKSFLFRRSEGRRERRERLEFLRAAMECSKKGETPIARAEPERRPEYPPRA